MSAADPAPEPSQPMLDLEKEVDMEIAAKAAAVAHTERATQHLQDLGVHADALHEQLHGGKPLDDLAAERTPESSVPDTQLEAAPCHLQVLIPDGSSPAGEPSATEVSIGSVCGPAQSPPPLPDEQLAQDPLQADPLLDPLDCAPAPTLSAPDPTIPADPFNHPSSSALPPGVPHSKPYNIDTTPLQPASKTPFRQQSSVGSLSSMSEAGKDSGTQPTATSPRLPASHPNPTSPLRSAVPQPDTLLPEGMADAAPLLPHDDDASSAAGSTHEPASPAAPMASAPGSFELGDALAGALKESGPKPMLFGGLQMEEDDGSTGGDRGGEGHASVSTATTQGAATLSSSPPAAAYAAAGSSASGAPPAMDRKEGQSATAQASATSLGAGSRVGASGSAAPAGDPHQAARAGGSGSAPAAGVGGVGGAQAPAEPARGAPRAGGARSSPGTPVPALPSAAASSLDSAGRGLPVGVPLSTPHGSSSRSAACDMLTRKKRHYFIISNSGRPIYSRHGHTHETASIAGMIYGLVSLSMDACGEVPSAFTAGDLAICVRALPASNSQQPPSVLSYPAAAASQVRGATLSSVPTIIVGACRAPLPPRVLRLHCELLHCQLLSWTTAKYEQTLVENPTIDMGKTLAGTEASFATLLKRAGCCMDFVLQACEMLRLPAIVRDAAAKALQTAVDDSDCIFALAACGHQVVAMGHNSKLSLTQRPHAWDVLLLLNLVASNPDYLSSLAGQQAWVPLCLPRSSPSSFSYVYVHAVEPSNPLFLALVSRSHQKFFDVHSAREALVEKLQMAGVLQTVSTAAKAADGNRISHSQLPLTAKLEALRLAVYSVFVRKCAAAAFVRTAFSPILADPKVQKAVMQDCMRVHACMWGAASASKTSDPAPLQWRATARWNILGSIQAGEFEAYLVVDPLVSHVDAVALFNQIVAHLLRNTELWQHDEPEVRSVGTLFGDLSGLTG